MTARVLVPLDGSAASESILPALRRLLPPDSSSLTLLLALTGADHRPLAEADRYLRQVAAGLTDDGYPVRTCIRRAEAETTILDAVASESSTLIALATHGRSGVDRLLLGSVAEHILCASPVPVLITRPAAAVPAAAPTLRILVPLDESLEALDAVAPVIGLAAGFNARVRLLRVAPPTPYPGHWERPDATMRIAEHLIREACIPTDLDHRRGRASEEILKAATEHGADVIVMATHGRSEPARLVLGSTTTEVLRHAPVPVLALRRQALQKPGSFPEFSSLSRQP